MPNKKLDTTIICKAKQIILFHFLSLMISCRYTNFNLFVSRQVSYYLFVRKLVLLNSCRHICTWLIQRRGNICCLTRHPTRLRFEKTDVFDTATDKTMSNTLLNLQKAKASGDTVIDVIKVYALQITTSSLLLINITETIKVFYSFQQTARILVPYINCTCWEHYAFSKLYL